MSYQIDMHDTTPEIFLIAEPQLDWGEIERYLVSVGGTEWFDRIPVATKVTRGDQVTELIKDAEALVEFMGRLCYRSWKPGLNPNVTRVRTDSHEYITNMLKQLHGSVFEHAQFSFVFSNVSRVFTHELVRHRAGVAISQESLRYVRLTELGFRIPEVLEPMRDTVVSIVETLEEFQIEAAETFGLDNENVPFHVKKEVTSALRRLAPIGLSTTIGWSANVRTLRHVIEQRTALGAEEEIRLVFTKVALILRERYPMLFGDLQVNSNGEFITPFHKI